MSELDEGYPDAHQVHDEMGAVKAHRDLLLQRLDDILDEFADFRKMAEADKVEYGRRATRFKVALAAVGLVLLALAGVAWGTHKTSIRLESFVACQTAFNDTVNRATAIRSAASSQWTTATLAYGAVRNDPISTPEQINAARARYYETLRNLAEAQQNNPVPQASNCRLQA